MSSKDDKWVMFRNYMHNELGITKDDIKSWISDAINEQVKLVVNNTFSRVDLEKMCERLIREEIRHTYEIKEAIIDKILNSIKFE